MDPLEALAILVAGLAAGAINTIVGSGTLITFPVLIALGYPPLVANVSNNIGLVPGAVSGAWGYRRELAGQRERVLQLGAFSVVGAAGRRDPVARSALLRLRRDRSRPDRDRARARGGAAAAQRVARPAPAPGTSQPEPCAAWLRACGVYGGYFGAAQGILLMGILGLAIDDTLQRLNGLKNVVAGLNNFTAGLIFVFAASIDWGVAGLIAAGSMVGGVLGARYGRRLSPDRAPSRHRDRRHGRDRPPAGRLRRVTPRRGASGTCCGSDTSRRRVVASPRPARSVSRNDGPVDGLCDPGHDQVELERALELSQVPRLVGHVDLAGRQHGEPGVAGQAFEHARVAERGRRVVGGLVFVVGRSERPHRIEEPLQVVVLARPPHAHGDQPARARNPPCLTEAREPLGRELERVEAGDDIERVVVPRQVLDRPDAQVGVRQPGPGALDHALGGVDAAHRRAAPGRERAQLAGPAAHVEEPGLRTDRGLLDDQLTRRIGEARPVLVPELGGRAPCRALLPAELGRSPSLTPA